MNVRKENIKFRLNQHIEANQKSIVMLAEMALEGSIDKHEACELVGKFCENNMRIEVMRDIYTHPLTAI